MRTSVIVTTYQRPDALLAVLRSLQAQTADNFEILVADDGSGPATASMIASEQRNAKVSLRHVWQPDEGFRAGAARNRAAALADGDYLVFLDGDCIARPDWLARHLGLARTHWMVAGNRVLLSREFTAQVLTQQLQVHAWSMSQWRQAHAGGAINRLAPLRALPLAGLRRWGARRWQRVRTCNLGLWRADFERVNGFDETYAGWGFEDSDLAVRLIHAGVGRLDGAFATAVLHLWHHESDRQPSMRNRERLTQRLASSDVLAEQGLDRYRSAALLQAGVAPHVPADSVKATCTTDSTSSSVGQRP